MALIVAFCIDGVLMKELLNLDICARWCLLFKALYYVFRPDWL